MPVTDRLLKKLQETLGEEPTHDLVSWVDEAGAVTQAEIREVADLYLSRFGERLERRFAEQNAKLEHRFAEQGAKLEHRFAEQGAKLEHRFAEQDAKLEHRLVGIEHQMATGFAAVRVEMADRLSAQYRDLLRWLFIFFWAGTIVPLAGLMIALIKL